MSRDVIRNPWAESVVLVTGVSGTVGRELLRQLIIAGTREIIGVDNNETEIFFLSEEHRDTAGVHLYVGDVRDRSRMQRLMEGVSVVIHAAALKHVVLCEHAPNDALQTNIMGTQNIIDAAIGAGVGRVIFTSSDKAVNPTNVMGTSKLMAERLITAANAMRRGDGPIFASTRFGNVLGSRGSVVPIFRQQILRGGPVTITDRDMTRFVMTLQQAALLVMESVFRAKGGEVFITKMPVIRVVDLAAVMIEELARRNGLDRSKIDTKVIGAKAGEKLYEELMSEEETRRTVELEKYFCVLPAFKTVYRSIEYSYDDVLSTRIAQPYNSTFIAPMSPDELASYLEESALLGG